MDGGSTEKITSQLVPSIPISIFFHPFPIASHSIHFQLHSNPSISNPISFHPFASHSTHSHSCSHSHSNSHSHSHSHSHFHSLHSHSQSRFHSLHSHSLSRYHIHSNPIHIPIQSQSHTI